MAIVPDKSGTRPGRPGNIPLSDPRNRGYKERSTTDDSYVDELRFVLPIGNTLVTVEDKTRNQLFFITAEDAATVFVSTAPMVSPVGIPVYGGAGLQLRGKSTELAYYVYATEETNLSVLIG